MKIRVSGKSLVSPEEVPVPKKEDAAVADFHEKRIHTEDKFEARREATNSPEGNYEYEQMVAEDANYNSKKMIEEAAFFIAESRGFAPGCEHADWLEAEQQVESSLRAGGQQFHLLLPGSVH